MTREEIFDAWAPPTSIWSPWAKPVLFSQINRYGSESILPLELPIDVNWAIDPSRATAMVVDFPGPQGVSLALTLSSIGYCPVPLYNACPATPRTAALVDVEPIMSALIAAASLLGSFHLPDDAPPVFLLDAKRNNAIAAPLPGMFDNRSISLPTDFPSANFLLSRGIRRIVVVQSGPHEPRTDLSHTLLRWQEAGLEILTLDFQAPDVPRSITVRRPKTFRLLWYNFLAKVGLRSNPLGGFGGRLPMPSSG